MSHSKKIEVKRSVHIEQSNYSEDAMVTSVGYISNSQNVLMETVSFGTQRKYYFDSRGILDSGYTTSRVIRRSIDNGKSWEVIEKWPHFSTIHGRRELMTLSPSWIVNPKTDSLLRIYSTAEFIRGTLPWQDESPYYNTGLTWMQVSHDQGQTWSEPEQIVVNGGQYNQANWAPDIRYGHNGGLTENPMPVWTSDGRVIVPIVCHTTEDMKAKDVHFQNAVLIGSWRSDDSGVDWDISSFVYVDPRKAHNNGEPHIAVLPNGKLLMILRSKNSPNDGLTANSAKFYSLSDNLGQTWADPELLEYTDGGQVYCPANLAHVFVSSKNNRLYIITNLLDGPTTKGCDPRTILQIAEIDQDSMKLIRDTVTVIESRDIKAGQPENIRFSNWGRYEDRENGNMVLFMAACPGDVGRSEECGCPPHSYRYEIIMPE